MLRAGIDLQNKIAIGARDMSELSAVRQRIDEEFRSAPVAGIGPMQVVGGILAGLLKADRVASHDRLKSHEVVQAVVAYVAGTDERARDSLGRIDVDTVDGVLAPYLAFAKADISDADDASAFLKAARLSPNSAVEEAAFRRAIRIYLRTERMVESPLLISRYLARYSRSPFAGELIREIEEFLVQAGRKSGSFERLQRIGLSVGSDRWVRSALALARFHLLAGNFGDAKKFAEAARQAADRGSIEFVRADLYRDAAAFDPAAARAASPDPRLNDWDRDLANFLQMSSREAALASDNFANASLSTATSAVSPDVRRLPHIEGKIEEAERLLAKGK